VTALFQFAYQVTRTSKHEHKGIANLIPVKSMQLRVELFLKHNYQSLVNLNFGIKFNNLSFQEFILLLLRSNSLFDSLVDELPDAQFVAFLGSLLGDGVILGVEFHVCFWLG